ncbi:MAG: PilZ domain-containing protein [Pseudomonadales bacterium]
MADNKRVHIRNKLRAEVKLSHPEVGDLKLHTSDISEGGAYILSEGNALPSVGEVVEVQVQGLGDGGAGPLVKMKIVRFDNDGIGLVFVNEDSASD